MPVTHQQRAEPGLQGRGIYQVASTVPVESLNLQMMCIQVQDVGRVVDICGEADACWRSWAVISANALSGRRAGDVVEDSGRWLVVDDQRLVCLLQKTYTNLAVDLQRCRNHRRSHSCPSWQACDAFRKISITRRCFDMTIVLGQHGYARLKDRDHEKAAGGR